MFETAVLQRLRSSARPCPALPGGGWSRSPEEARWRRLKTSSSHKLFVSLHLTAHHLKLSRPLSVSFYLVLSFLVFLFFLPTSIFQFFLTSFSPMSVCIDSVNVHFISIWMSLPLSLFTHLLVSFFFFFPSFFFLFYSSSLSICLLFSSIIL